MMQKANRKSHLQAPLSPSTQALLRSEGPFSGGHSPGKDTSTSKTPTSGEIPIATSAGTSATSAAYAPEPPVQRVVSADANGAPHGTVQHPSQQQQQPQLQQQEQQRPMHALVERPHYPPRTTSASAVPSGRLRERDGERMPYMQPTVMPIRPAPPPGGPLPAPPSREGGAPRRPMYPYGQEGQPI